MRKSKVLIFILSLLAIVCSSYADSKITQRISQFSNDKVNVWKTVIYHTPEKKLKMHRHEYDRVVIALTNGTLKITNDKGKVHYFKLVKDEAYYLTKDAPGEMHSDENIGRHPIKLMVIELKS
ncbi:MAG: hypothetical protein JSS53_08375 [Proteobacteria bacterium]|nr:hypothetical protein [Pseudomonadota bacterium]